ncbi:hypothetical protein INS49_014735 [Diaporthe citri]|uniref:uncharacterized protein n=1 Tax=Diaporthe citri TaxID=83186 RepID=UPI001C817EC4|nr:uncharacterized protein INS49_014735 [Diaporthe citri]KAG6356861.1 hypothetical protein INS49_014735 [Diaporthe citri]
MDPLTAFGLAANVVSFVSFASGLIKTTVELHRSGSDAEDDVLSLEKVYRDLETQSSELERTAHGNTPPWVPTPDECEAEKTVLAVKRLAELCKGDCDELLQITDKLRLRRGDLGSKWKSFRVAIRKSHSKLQDQSVELQIDQNERLEEVKKSLTRFEQMLADARNDKDARLIPFRNYELLDQLLRQFWTAKDLRSKLRGIMAPTDSQWLIEAIVNRCDGVFLWVFLVTKLLREGMTNRDRFPDLRRRLESFPRELRPFFRQILDSVEPIYHAKRAAMLRIALTAEKPLHMIMYDLHDLEHDDEYYYRPRLIKPFTLEGLSQVKTRITYHLDSRTRGLLEVSPTLEVTFLHRTVKDYLASEGLSHLPEIDLPRGSGRKFSPELSILRAYAAWVKCAAPDRLHRYKFAEYSYAGGGSGIYGITPSIIELTTDLIPYAAQLDRQMPVDPRLGEALDDIDSSIATLISRARSRPGSSGEEAWNEDRLFEDYGICAGGKGSQEDFAWATNVFFRERLAKAGVTNYVAAKELKEPTTGRSLVAQRSLADDQYWWNQRVWFAYLQSFRLFRGLWEVYAILFRYFLFFLFPFTLRLGSFLIQCLPPFLSRLVIIPFMSRIAKYAYANSY